jgi:hypothetical protein
VTQIRPQHGLHLPHSPVDSEREIPIVLASIDVRIHGRQSESSPDNSGQVAANLSFGPECRLRPNRQRFTTYDCQYWSISVPSMPFAPITSKRVEMFTRNAFI